VFIVGGKIPAIVDGGGEEQTLRPKYVSARSQRLQGEGPGVPYDQHGGTESRDCAIGGNLIDVTFL